MWFFRYSPAVTKGLIRLRIFLTCLLEMPLGLLTSYFRSPKGSQKIFLGSSLAVITFWWGGFIDHKGKGVGVGNRENRWPVNIFWSNWNLVFPGKPTKRGLSCQNRIHILSQCSYMCDASRISPCCHHKAYTSLLNTVNSLLPDTSLLKKTPVFRPCHFSVILL